MAIRKAIAIIWWLFHLHLLAALALPTASPSDSAKCYDVIIIGGGPGGLASAMSLGRVRRTALLIDSAVYRNAATRAMHDVPGLDGTAPWAFRALARQQISAYPTITMTNGTVTAITQASNSSNSTVAPNVFTITTLNGDTHCSRRVILAMGIRDILPNTPGLKELWGTVVYWCPWCDGWEHKDKPFGLITSFSTSAINSSITFAQTLNPGNVLLTNGTATAKARAEVDQSLPDWQARMKQWNVTLDDRVIEKFGPAPKPVSTTKKTGARKNKIRRADPPVIVNNKQESQHEEDEEGLEIFFSSSNSTTTPKDSSALNLNAVKIAPPIEISSESLVHSMGLSTIPDENEAPKVGVDKHMETSIKGIFAVGDMNSDGSTNVAHALWSAKGAVVYMHGGLGREYADEKAAAAKMKKNGKRGTEKMKRDDEETWMQIDGHPLDSKIAKKGLHANEYASGKVKRAEDVSAEDPAIADFSSGKESRSIGDLWKRLLPQSLTPRAPSDSTCEHYYIFNKASCDKQKAAEAVAAAKKAEAEAEAAAKKAEAEAEAEAQKEESSIRKAGEDNIEAIKAHLEALSAAQQQITHDIVSGKPKQRLRATDVDLAAIVAEAEESKESKREEKNGQGQESSTPASSSSKVKLKRATPCSQVPSGPGCLLSISLQQHEVPENIIKEVEAGMKDVETQRVAEIQVPTNEAPPAGSNDMVKRAYYGTILGAYDPDALVEEAEAEAEAKRAETEAANAAEKWSHAAGLEDLKQRVRQREVEAREVGGQEDPFAAAREMMAFMNE